MTVWQQGYFSGHEKRRVIPDINLFSDCAVLVGEPQVFDGNFITVVSAFPHIGKTTGGNWFVTNFGKIARNGV